jgi:streptogramin lyase
MVVPVGKVGGELRPRGETMTRSWLTGALGLVTLIAAAAAAAADPFPDVIQLPTGWRPEGIEAGRQHTLYVGSIPTGAVRQIDARTGESLTLVQPTAGRSATGLEYDRKDGRLFVSGSGTGSAYVYDAQTGEPIADYLLTDTAPRFINDNVLTKDAVYFTDSQRPWFYRLPLGNHGELPAASDVQTIPLSGDYEHQEGVNNLNGIVATPNGKMLIAVQSSTASLLRIDPSTGVADTIELTGGDATNGDGLLLEGQTLYVVQNRLNQVAVIHLAPDLSSGTVVNHLTHPAFRVPTTIDKVSGRLYLPNARFGVTSPDTEAYEVVGLG